MHRVFQDITIDVVAPEWSQGLLARMPEVRKSIILPFKHGDFKPIKRWLFGKALRSEGYDWSIVLPGSWKSAIIPLGASIHRRTGWLGEKRYVLLNDFKELNKEKFPFMVQRYLALADLNNHFELSYNMEQINYPQLSINESNKEKLFQSLKLNTVRPVVGICPGAEFGPSKMWPVEYYAKLSSDLIQKGYQVWLFGSPNDKAVGKKISSLVNENEKNAVFLNDLIGKTELVDVVDLMSACAYVVGNDSGLMHIASAVNVFVVVIYGSTSPEFTPPLTKRSIPIRKKLECSPCFQRECPLVHFKCMKGILPEFVIAEMNADLFIQKK